MGAKLTYDIFRDNEIIKLGVHSNEVLEIVGCTPKILCTKFSDLEPIVFIKGYRIVRHEPEPTMLSSFTSDPAFVKTFRQEWEEVCKAIRGESYGS